MTCFLKRAEFTLDSRKRIVRKYSYSTLIKNISIKSPPEVNMSKQLPLLSGLEQKEGKINVDTILTTETRDSKDYFDSLMSRFNTEFDTDDDYFAKTIKITRNNADQDPFYVVLISIPSDQKLDITKIEPLSSFFMQPCGTPFPMVIRAGKKFWIYGYKTDLWTLTELVLNEAHNKIFSDLLMQVPLHSHIITIIKTCELELKAEQTLRSYVKKLHSLGNTGEVDEKLKELIRYFSRRISLFETLKKLKKLASNPASKKEFDDAEKQVLKLFEAVVDNIAGPEAGNICEQVLDYLEINYENVLNPTPYITFVLELLDCFENDAEDWQELAKKYAITGLDYQSKYTKNIMASHPIIIERNMLLLPALLSRLKIYIKLFEEYTYPEGELSYFSIFDFLEKLQFELIDTEYMLMETLSVLGINNLECVESLNRFIGSLSQSVDKDIQRMTPNKLNRKTASSILSYLEKSQSYSEVENSEGLKHAISQCKLFLTKPISEEKFSEFPPPDIKSSSGPAFFATHNPSSSSSSLSAIHEVKTESTRTTLSPLTQASMYAETKRQPRVGEKRKQPDTPDTSIPENNSP